MLVYAWLSLCVCAVRAREAEESSSLKPQEQEH